MRIVFNKIFINNFFSIGEVELNLKSNGFVSVSGINNNPLDSAKANGAGKSTLFESIIWALTGETVRGTRDVVNEYNPGGTKVELDFNIDETYYKIIRYREHKEFGTTLKIYVDGEDKSGKGIRDSEAILKQYLPDLTTSLLGSVIILGQGLPQRFTNNTPSGRKEVLEILSKSDFMIQDIKNKLTNRRTELNTELRKQEDDILGLNTKIEMYKTNLEKLKTELNSFTGIEEIEDKLKEEEQALSKLDIELIKAISEVTNKEENLEKERNRLETELTEKNKVIDAHNKGYLDIYNKMKDDNSSLRLQIESLKTEINKFRNIKDTCPTCQQKLPHVHKVDTSEMEIELERFEHNYKTELEALNKYKEQREEERKELENVFEDNIKSLRENINSLNEDLRNSKTTNSMLEFQKTKLNELIFGYKHKISSYKESKDKIQNDIKELEISISESTKKVLYIINNKDNISNKLDIVNKMFSIASRDFRGYLLLEIINYINTRVKKYSEIIFGNDSTEFKLDGNNIYIGYNGREYTNLSGGEKQKVDIIIQFSLKDMLNTFLDFSSNILVLDEIFDNLDSIGCDRVVNMIITEMADIESVFIITHHSDIDIPVDKEIIIEKDQNGVSRIV